MDNKYKQGSTNKAVLLLLMVLLVCTDAVLADFSQHHVQHTVNIPAQNAVAAFSQLADQTGAEFVFPYDIAKQRTTQAVVGRYTVIQALTVMLRSSGLSCGLSDNGAIRIFLSDGSDNYFEGMTMKNRNNRKKMLAAVVAFFAGGGSVQGVYAEEGGEEKSWMLEEVVVTAQKRTQSLSDVPLSVNAFGAEQIRDSGINYLSDIEALAAGIKIGGNLKTPNINIRGIGANSNAPGFDAGVATHVDGVYLGQRLYITTAMFDTERIEVVRGPQGTLYGRNATGGVVNIITKAPSQDFEAGVIVTAGNYDLLDTEAFVNVPHNDQWASRLAVKHSSRDGYTENTQGGDDIGNADSVAIRAKTQFDASADFTVSLSVNYADDQSVDSLINTRRTPSIPTSGEVAGGTLATGRAVNSGSEDSSDYEIFGAILRMDWALDEMNFVSITGHREFDGLQRLDNDRTEVDLLYVSDWASESSQFSQEFNLSSSGEQTVDWLFGAFYFSDTYSDKAEFASYGDPSFFLGVEDLETEASAVFTEVSFLLSESMQLAFGARYSQEERRIKDFFNTSVVEVEDDWDAFTPKVTLSFTPDEDTLVYFTIAEGFKAGGFNGYRQQESSFDPEQVINYELGFKGVALDETLRLSAALFYMDYSDLQVSQRVLLPGGAFGSSTVVTNAAESTIQGLELEFDYWPTERLSIGGNISYLDATYDDYASADNLRDNDVFDVSGNQLIAAPKLAYHFNVNYHIPIEPGTIALRAEYSYQSDVYFSPFEDVISLPGRMQEAYGLVNARIGFEDNDNVWEFSLFGRNLTDEEVIDFGFVGNPGASMQFLFHGAPRTYGAQVSYNF